jgi:hypothetical protein
MSLESPSAADFRVLGVDPDSKPSEVKQAYRALVKRWHPDRHHSKSYETRALAEEKFREIDEAYKRIAQSWKTRSGTQKSAARVAPEAGDPEVRRPAVRTLDLRTFRSLRRARFAAPAILIIVSAILLTELLLYFSGPSVDFETRDRIVGENSQKENLNKGQPPGQLSDLETQLLPEKPEHPESVQPAPLLQSPPQALSPFFTMGSSTAEVLAVQGPPSRIQGQTWTYGLSEVQFKNGRVWSFNNFDGSLRILMQPGGGDGEKEPDYITIGSSENDVLRVQGTPSKVEGEKWYYGFAELRFKNGNIREYDNYFGNLKVRLLPSKSSGIEQRKNCFTIGSTPDEVLAVQGTPTGIHGNTWSFSFSSVSFRDGKVNHVSNTDGGLHFVPAEEPVEKSGS